MEIDNPEQGAVGRAPRSDERGLPLGGERTHDGAEISTPRTGNPIGLGPGPIRFIPALLLAGLFLAGVGGGIWVGPSIPRRTEPARPVQLPEVKPAASSSQVVRDLFLPLENGEKALHLSLSVRVVTPAARGPQTVGRRWLCGAVYDAVQEMSVEDLMGLDGMRVLKGRILKFAGREHPEFKIEDIYFLDYTVL